MTRFSTIFPMAAVMASLAAPLTVRASGFEGRDPFRPFLLGAPALITTSPLQRFSLDDLHIDGIVSGISDPRALVRTPTGETFEVSLGGLIGNHNGRIAQITKDSVVVVEWTDDTKRELILGLSPAGN